MFEDDKVGNEQNLEEIRHMSYLKDLLITAYKYIEPEDRIALFKRAEDELVNA